MSEAIELTSLQPGDVINWAGSGGGAIVTHVWTDRAESDGLVTFAIVWRNTNTNEWHVSSLTWSTDRDIYVIAQLRPSVPEAQVDRNRGVTPKSYGLG